VRADPWKTTVADAEAIVRAPFGAHPFYSRGYYIQDNEHLKLYSDATREAAARERRRLDDYLNHYCREPVSHGDYLERIGIKRLLQLNEY
jgi:glutaconate CoA-transferase subunit A